MTLSIGATVLVALFCMMPGWLALRGSRAEPGMVSAAMAASLAVSMMATALLAALGDAFGLGSWPAIAVVPVSIAMAAALWFRHRRDVLLAKRGGEQIEWQGPVLGAVFLGFGLFVQWLAVREMASGALAVHAWFNADWFKHLGHVNAIANHGLPAADGFNNAGKLHYYWLSYILPGAGAAIGKDSWSALASANSILVMLFGSVWYGVLRETGAGRSTALAVGILSLFASATLIYTAQMVSGALAFEDALRSETAPRGPALLAMSHYIPQHLFALVLLLGWFRLRNERAGRLLALAGLATIMTISIFLGGLALGAYGLYRLATDRGSAVREVAIMAVVSLALVGALEVVKFANVDSAIESPLLQNERVDLPFFAKLVGSAAQIIGPLGAPFFLTVAVLWYWKPSVPREREIRLFAICLILAGLAAIAAEFVLSPRVAFEVRLRAVNLPALANGLVGALALSIALKGDARTRAIGLAVAAVLVMLALPSAAIRTAWHGQLDDAFTTIIPADDRAILAAVRHRTKPRALVLQYPEPPFLARESGGDAWAAILGQRTVTASIRATDYPMAAPAIEAAKRFFAGEEQPVAQRVDVVYLSRSLHPGTYEKLLSRMEAEPGFATLECRQDACVFARPEAMSQ